MVLDKYFLVFFILAIFLNIFLIKNTNNFFFKNFIDNHYYKPQAFHKNPTPRTGGFVIFFLSFFYLIFFLKINFFIISLIILGFVFFLIGFIEDMKKTIDPIIRLLLMFFFCFFVVYFFNIKILNTQFNFLNDFLNTNNFFSSLFVCLCIVFIINGSNLIDGFNGLLIFHFLIILSALLILNIYFINNYDRVLINIIVLLFILSIAFLIFNFPISKIFLGDSGAYLIGTFLSLITIEMSNLNKEIPPFFFACLLFYLFFEVFFSFLRKIFLARQSPIKPDKLHLHMLIYALIKNKDPKKANFLTSLSINFFFIILVIPLFFFLQHKNFYKIYFFLLIIFYLFLYFILYTKNKIR
jgi:UDP-N-acetylmuramyl pentapeptide phosphotransferase/UDP-N-acetylglucosamine-1-phosphate transferase